MKLQEEKENECSETGGREKVQKIWALLIDVKL